MFKVGIIGPEASGKSTLARYLAKRYNALLIPEYAREYVEAERLRRQSNQPIEVSFDELCTIAKQQIAQLQTLTPTNHEEVAVFDTELIVTKVWFDYAFGNVPEWLEKAIKKHPMDVYLLTYPDLEWTQDGARYNGSDEIRMELFERYEREIQQLGIPYYIITHQT